MNHTAADILIDTIAEWGVEVIFGMPGDGINGIMEALRKRQERIRWCFSETQNMDASCSPSILPVSPGSAAGRGSLLKTPPNAAEFWTTHWRLLGL